MAMNLKSSLLKSICPPWYPKRFLRSFETEHNVSTADYVRKLSETLGCSSGTAGILLTRNKKILISDLNDVQKVALFCRSNFRLSEVIELPEVLSLSAYVLKDRTLALRELGCRTVTAGNVLFFKHFIQQTPVDLHRNGFEMNPEAYFADTVSNLKCSDDIRLQMTSKLLNLYSKNFTLLKMKALINAMYLTWKLEYSEDKVLSALDKCSALGTKSLISLENVYDVLLGKFQLPLSKVYSSLNLLTLDCDSLEELMIKVPVICGVSIQHVARKHPSVLKRKANSLIGILRILESHEITAAQLLSCPKIFNCSASTILSRLSILKNTKNYMTLKEDERFLWLVFHFNNASENTKLMEGLKVLQSSKMPLNYKRLHSYSNGRFNFRDICFYLAAVFGNSTEDIKKELKQYPIIDIATLGNVQKIVEYLTAQGITKEQLWNGVGIVLYDAEVVIEYFKKLSDREDLQPPFSKRIGHHNVIQLLIYEIEKEQNLTGNGVYIRSANNRGESSENGEVLQDEEEEEILALCNESGDNDYVYNVNDL